MNTATIKKQYSHESIKELLNLFWSAPDQSYFNQRTVAIIVTCSQKTLENDRWRGIGIPYRKCSGRILYRKADVIAWIERHQLITSTSECVGGGVTHAK